MTTNIIETKDLTKVFYTKSGPFLAIKEVSFHLEEHGFISLVGPSGWRKVDHYPAPGWYHAHQRRDDLDIRRDVRQGEEGERQCPEKMGFVFQSPNLLPWLTVRQNLELPLKVYKLNHNEEYKKNVDESLRIINMQGYASSYPSDLSGGMRQRVGVMRAMVYNADILLMDEPFGALDDESRVTLDLETQDIWQRMGKSIIFITHNITEAVLVSNRVIVMATNPGRIIDEVTIDLPRPRTREMMKLPAFTSYVEQIRDCIGKIDLSAIK